MPTEKIRQLEEKTTELEERMARLAEHDEHEGRLASGVERLRLSTDQLNGVLAVIVAQNDAIRDVDSKASGINERVTLKTNAAETARTRLWRSLVLVALVLAGLIVFAVIGTRQVNAASDAAKTASESSAHIAQVAHEQCIDRNASLQVTITRERSLAETDVPATRDAHRESALRYEGLIRNCNAVYPPTP